MFYGKALYLPYAVGCLAAYAWQFERIKQNYEIGGFLYKRDPIDETVKNIKDPGVVALSCYTWTFEYNKKLAEEIKKLYPDCFIIFGGHNVSENQPILEELSYVDALIYGEGERPFKEMLEALANGYSFYEINNIAFRNNDKIIVTPKKEYDSVEDYLSPYLEGYFDPIVEANPDTEFCAVLETNRGCPYHCAYCDWCYSVKIRRFPMEKVLDEIRWLSENMISYCFCADSNFGMFERDYDIALALINAKKETGFPRVFRPCYEKNSDERVFKICKALNQYDMDKGATIAYQTLCDEALKNIGRKNLTIEHFSFLMQKYNQAEIPTYSELILGLPGETLESFCKGICKLIENGQHNSMSVYYCEMLPNSEMSNPEYIKKHGIEVIKVAFNHIHSAKSSYEEVQEYSYLVRSTNTLTRDDWLKANLFSVCVQCFHSLGVLRCVAMYLHNENKTSYYDFYSDLLKFILNSNCRLNEIWKEFEGKYASSLSGDWNYYNPKFGNVTWFFEEGAFLEIISDLDDFFIQLDPFLKFLCIQSDLADEIIQYQKFVLRKPCEKSERLELHYNLKEYFDGIVKSKPVPLKRGKYVYKTAPAVEYESIEQYAKNVVWYGRRKGKTLYGSDEIVEE